MILWIVLVVYSYVEARREGYEAIAHCINRLFHLDETEGLLFVDAMSAFNLLN